MEKWRGFENSKYIWHWDANWMWSVWSVGLLFKAGRTKDENGLMIELLCFVIRIHWRQDPRPAHRPPMKMPFDCAQDRQAEENGKAMVR